MLRPLIWHVIHFFAPSLATFAQFLEHHHPRFIFEKKEKIYCFSTIKNVLSVACFYVFQRIFRSSRKRILFVQVNLSLETSFEKQLSVSFVILLHGMAIASWQSETTSCSPNETVFIIYLPLIKRVAERRLIFTIVWKYKSLLNWNTDFTSIRSFHKSRNIKMHFLNLLINTWNDYNSNIWRLVSLLKGFWLFDMWPNQRTSCKTTIAKAKKPQKS